MGEAIENFPLFFVTSLCACYCLCLSLPSPCASLTRSLPDVGTGFFFILISFRVCWNAVNAANAKCWIPCMTVYWCKCRLPALYLLCFFLSFFVSSFVCVSLCVSVRGILFLNESQKSFFFFGSPWVYGTFRGKFDRAFFLSSSIFAHRLSVPHYFIQFYLYTHTYMTHNLYELFERRKKNPTEERRKQKQAKKKSREESEHNESHIKIDV